MEKRFFVEEDIFRLVDPSTGVKEFVIVEATEMAKFDHIWSEYIAPGKKSGPEEISSIEPSEDRREVYQGIYAPRERILLYASLPSNIRLKGFPQLPMATSDNRRVGYDDNISSPFETPDFETEFFLRGNTNLSLLNLDAFNPTAVAVKPRVKFIVNKMLINPAIPSAVMDRLSRREIDFRSVTLGGLPSTRGEVLRG